MARAKSIGSLFIDIEARTAKLETDMGRVKNIVGQGTKEVANQGEQWAKLQKQHDRFATQLASRVAGAISLFSLLKREIDHVIKNVEEIKGLPPGVMQDIQLMRHDLVEAQRDVDVGIAKATSFIYRATKLLAALPAAAIETFQGRGKEASEALDEVVNGPKSLTPDQIAKDKDPKYDIELAKARRELEAATVKANVADSDSVTQIKMLREEATKLRSVTTDLLGQEANTLELTQNKIKALNLEAQANSKMQNLREQLIEQEKRVSASLDKYSTVTMSTRDIVTSYTQKVWRLRIELTSLNAVLKDDPNNPDYLKKKVDKTKELADAQGILNAALKKQGELGMQVGKSIADNLGDAILKGEGLHSMMDQIFHDILRIVLQKTILGPLGDAFGGFLGGIFGKSAAGGPIGRGYRIVGEHGPELIENQGYSTVIPNDKLRGGGGGNTFYIDASGADMAAIQRLEESLRQLAGPGVVERRAVGAVIATKWRRGGAGSNL